MEDIYLAESILSELDSGKDLSCEFSTNSAIGDDSKSWLDNFVMPAASMRQEPTRNTQTMDEIQEAQAVPGVFYDVNQIAILESEFTRCQVPHDNIVQELALQLNMPADLVKLWFDVRRLEQATLINNTVEYSYQSPTPAACEFGCYSSSVQTRRRIRRTRKCFKKHQLNILRDAFRKCQYPSNAAYDDLASQLEIPISRLRKWFGYQRLKQKKLQNIRNENRAFGIYLTKDQREILECEFQQCQKPDLTKIHCLSLEFRLQFTIVSSWFTHRRILQKALEKQDQLVQSQMGPYDNAAVAAYPSMLGPSQMSHFGYAQSNFCQEDNGYF